ncbi:MAG: ATP-binding protein, partial [Pseudomonadota bacterium]
EQVVTNLIQNALQALPDKSCGVLVTSEFDRTGNEIIVRVVDEGCGIDTSLADHIMEPFFTTRLEQGGTGLGLSICATIVKDHGGRLEFSSEAGNGTTFSMHLPAVKYSGNITKDAVEAVHDNG